jgi:DNA segregation ATPase FtsK/SpoIIIE, S-DNA-T family
VSANVPKRIVLRLSDDNSYAILGAPKDVLNERSAPGRAIVDGYETQLAVMGGTSNVARQTAALHEFAEQLRARGAVEIGEIGALPTELAVTELPDSVDGLPVLGISDDVLGPKAFEPIGTFVVTGPPRSGKSNAMRALITSMSRLDPDTKFFHIGGRRAVLRDFRPWVRSASSVEDVRALAKELTGIIPDETIPGRIVVVLENVPEFADSDAERPLKEMFQAINRSDHFLIGDGDVTQLGSGYGFIGDFKGGRRGIVLKPDTYDGDTLFKVPFGKLKRTDFPAGRGIFVQAGRTVTMQMPLASDSESAV